MNNNNKSIPFFVKVPLILAAVISLGLLLVVFLEGAKSRAELPVCTTTKMGKFENTAMVVGIERFPDGDYRSVSLNSKGDSWILNKLTFQSDFTPALEPQSTTANSMYAFEEVKYQIVNSTGNRAFLRTSTGRTLPIHFDSKKVEMLNQLGICGNQWSPDVRILRLNQHTFVSLEPSGRLGFYDSRNWQSVIPREAPRSPDTLMGVEVGNTLSVLSCGQPYTNSKARVRIIPGMLAFSSGETNDFAVYKVAPEKLSLESQRMSLDIGTNPFADFALAPYDQIGFKTSAWLERDEKWDFYPLRHLQGALSKAVTVGEPLEMREEYRVIGESEPQAVWFAERRRPYNLLKEYGLTVAAPAGEAKKFILKDETAISALTDKGLWTVLPGGRHLFIQNKKSTADYSVVQCPL